MEILCLNFTTLLIFARTGSIALFKNNFDIKGGGLWFDVGSPPPQVPFTWGPQSPLKNTPDSTSAQIDEPLVYFFSMLQASVECTLSNDVAREQMHF